jgi:hypothetical protein
MTGRSSMARALLLIVVAILSVGAGVLSGTQSSEAGHSASGLLSFITPVGKGSNGEAHPLAHLTTPWHGTGSVALDFDEHLSDGTHGGYWGVFEAHIHVFAWHPGGTTGKTATASTYYQNPGPSGCKETRTDFKNAVTGNVEAEYDLLHVVGSNVGWTIWGKDPMIFNDLLVGTAAASDSCPWDGVHIHETHRNRGGDHGHNHVFGINSTRWDCTCDPHGVYNKGSHWTRNVQW